MADENAETGLSNVETVSAEQAAKVETAKEPEKAPGIDLEAIKSENLQLRQMVEKAQAEAQGARQYVEQLVGHIQNAAQQGGNRPGPSPEDIRDKFVDNPVGVVNDLFNERMAPIYGTYIQNQSIMNRQLAAERLSSQGWTKYEKEVDDFMKDIPADVRAQPGSYEQAFRFIQAKHLDEIVEERASQRLTKEQQAFVEGSNGASTGGKTTPKLSVEERTVADGLGLTEAEYIKWRDVAP